MCNILAVYNPLANSQQLNLLSTLYQMQFELDRMYKNTQLINQGVNAKEITVSGTTLFRVAAEQYEDATLWTYLAQVNNLTDPTITMPVTLMVPPKPGANLSFGT